MSVIMEERRKSKRSELKSSLIIKRLDQSDEQIGIEILDVSKTGVGFNCDQRLMIGSVYESYLTIWTKEVLHAFFEIRRIEKIDEYKHQILFTDGTILPIGHLFSIKGDLFQNTELTDI